MPEAMVELLRIMTSNLCSRGSCYPYVRIVSLLFFSIVFFFPHMLVCLNNMVLLYQMFKLYINRIIVYACVMFLLPNIMFMRVILVQLYSVYFPCYVNVLHFSTHSIMDGAIKNSTDVNFLINVSEICIRFQRSRVLLSWNTFIQLVRDPFKFATGFVRFPYPNLSQS